MADVRKVRELFEISGMWKQYHTVACSVFADTVTHFGENDEHDEPSEECNAFADDYVTFVIEKYAERFTDAEIRILLKAHRQPVFAKLYETDDVLADVMGVFFLKKLSSHFDLDVEQAVSQLLPSRRTH